MRSAVVAATFAGAASAAWAPPYHDGGSWGQSSSAAPVSSAPAYSAPAYSSAAPVSSVAPAYTTEIVTAFTTFCPEATKFTHGGETYTATEATTLTITNCPGGCTITYPQSSWGATTSSEVAPTGYSTSVVVSSAPAPPASSGVAPYTTGGSSAAPVYPTGTAAPVGTSATASYGATGSPISSAPPATGGAAQSYASFGAAIMAVFGLVAAI